MGTGVILLRSNPAMDQHPLQEGTAILLGMLNAKETGISPGRLDLWFVCVFTFSTTTKICFFSSLRNAHQTSSTVGGC